MAQLIVDCERLSFSAAAAKLPNCTTMCSALQPSSVLFTGRLYIEEFDGLDPGILLFIQYLAALG